jgi:hypothetical protein
MNLRKWLFKTKETITTALTPVVLFTANTNSNNSNNKKLSEKPKEEKETFRRYYWL